MQYYYSTKLKFVFQQRLNTTQFQNSSNPIRLKLDICFAITMQYCISVAYAIAWLATLQKYNYRLRQCRLQWLWLVWNVPVSKRLNKHRKCSLLLPPTNRLHLLSFLCCSDFRKRDSEQLDREPLGCSRHCLYVKAQVQILRHVDSFVWILCRTIKRALERTAAPWVHKQQWFKI